MRTIKFRGKDRRTGKWFYGNLYVKDTRRRTHICTPERGCLDIDPETIGQFTGLYDCDGAEIYEGDIVKWEKDGLMYAVRFWHGMFYASVEECNEGILGGFPLHALTEHDYRKVEVIGNMYDNPELLKGGENEQNI